MGNIAKNRREARLRRHTRVRKKIHGTAERPRLAVHRTNKHFSMQLIDDDARCTSTAASSASSTRRPRSIGRRPELLYGSQAVYRQLLVRIE